MNIVMVVGGCLTELPFFDVRSRFEAMNIVRIQLDHVSSDSLDSCHTLTDAQRAGFNTMNVFVVIKEVFWF